MSKNIVPAISVIMSVYSEPIEWIKQAIDSILNQTFTGFEFIIVNDNPSRTENRNLLSAYADERIHLISNSENVGLTKSLNFALALAKGKYIARMDADDISLPSRFLKQFEYLEAHPEIGVCGCNVETFGSKRLVWTYPATHQECLLFFRSPFAHPAVMIRHSILKDNHILYDERLR